MRLKFPEKSQKNTMTSMFSPGQCVGIEITPKAVHMVQLSAHSLNQIKLDKYLSTPLPKNIFSGYTIEDYDQLVASLQQAWKTFGSSCKNITTGIPLKLVNVQFSRMDLDDGNLESAVEMELSQYGDLMTQSYDYADLGGSNRERDVVMVNCEREVVDLRVDAFTEAGIVPSQVDVYLIGNINAVITWINQKQPELEKQTIAVFDVGYAETRAMVMQGGKLLYKQEINLGNEQLIQLVRRNYQITEDEAERILASVKKPADYHEKVENTFQSQLIQEIQRVLQFYYTSSQDSNDIQNIIVTGHAGSGTEGLAEKIQAQTNIAAQQVNPILLTKTDSSISKDQFLQDSNQLTVAFGLAVRGL